MNSRLADDDIMYTSFNLDVYNYVVVEQRANM